MKNILTVTWYTLREAMARKVFIFFSIISLLVVIFTAVILGVTNLDSIVNGFAGKNAAPMMVEIVSKLEIAIITPLASLGLLLAIFASSSFIPIMLEKGNIDLLLSKPVSRTQLLWGKYFGGSLVVFINIALLIIGVWLSISIKFSIWSYTFLWSILIITFTFAVLYSLIVLFGVMTKSSMFGMMFAYLIFLILSPLLKFAHGDMQTFITSGFWKGVIGVLHQTLPQAAGEVGYDRGVGLAADALLQLSRQCVQRGGVPAQVQGAQAGGDMPGEFLHLGVLGGADHLPLLHRVGIVHAHVIHQLQQGGQAGGVYGQGAEEQQQQGQQSVSHGSFFPAGHEPGAGGELH